MKNIAFVDLETVPGCLQIEDIGAVRSDGAGFHENSFGKLLDFLGNVEYMGGHNILKHDLTYLAPLYEKAALRLPKVIDTLYLSPLLFPERPYHRLLKDDKLLTDSINNPFNDSVKAFELFREEVDAFEKLDDDLQFIYYSLLGDTVEFGAFFHFINYHPDREGSLPDIVRCRFRGKICESAPLAGMVVRYPLELAYTLALIDCEDRYSITPPWVLHAFPDVDRLMTRLRNTHCAAGCPYCNKAFDIYSGLKKYFGFSSYRLYNNEPLQAGAVDAAVKGKSILAVFPTGGGKSITFQVPALMCGETVKGLTVVISPLQSLMKDQVDNLRKHNITEAVTINGLLDPVERANSFERVEDGSASMLYISPESLRSRSIERLLLGRKIVRFVIDEAHCFSAWGQDFRVDYLYIGDFLKQLQQKKKLVEPIPVSCFTATAKQKVIEDIKEYFKVKLNIDFELFRAGSSRTNLRYKVFKRGDKREKYNSLREIIEAHSCPVIVYVSRTRTASGLAAQLVKDGIEARAYHGKMDVREKTDNQNAFIAGDVQVMVATSAFGMGVDKKDVGLVVHYEISDSLENYVQEAGRAGRDEHITADCFILFDEEDLNKHFILLNQTKLHMKEIQQVWKAIKELTRFRSTVSQSALEIARRAGWDDNIADIETRVTTAIAALEEAGYIHRGQNMPRVFANSIMARTAQEAIDRINASGRFSGKQEEQAIRIIKKLIATKSRKHLNNEIPEARIDYISDHLGITREDVIQVVTLLREEKILADAQDLTAYIKRTESCNRSLEIVRFFNRLDKFLLGTFTEREGLYNLKELREEAEQAMERSVSPDKLKVLINFWAEKDWLKREYQDAAKNHVAIVLTEQNRSRFREKAERRYILSDFIINVLFGKAGTGDKDEMSREEVLVEFSVLELKEEFEKEERRRGSLFRQAVSTEDVEDALFYLSRISALQIEGGFLVVYNKLYINRIILNNLIKYKQEDYRKLELFYENKIQQIHIVGEYAQKMVEDYQAALQFVDDYFNLNNASFLQKYFPGNRRHEIGMKMTRSKYMQVFGELSEKQLAVVKDNSSKHIVVLAGPGSGKTRVLVHKLASLLLMEDVKHEQLLMLTFSRAAAGEFRERLYKLIGNAVGYIEIKTFHSYCFDLLGCQGTLKRAESVVEDAVRRIRSGEVEKNRITKTVLVLDEAQDMTSHEFGLVEALIEKNEELRVIAVGDDDQNIYGFRGSDSRYMKSLVDKYDAHTYELLTNYRSKNNLVQFAGAFITRLAGRMKSSPVISKDLQDGIIHITHYKSANMVFPLVRDVCESNLAGSTCVLTLTNEDAMLIAFLLKERGMPVRLVQSNDGFRLTDLDEIHYFNSLLGLSANTCLIDAERWESAKRGLRERFFNASSMEVCCNIIRKFESLYEERKYRSDWEAFLFESRLEDFYTFRGEEINVSTIHKAKGKEFENVFLLLNDDCKKYTSRLREIYVAITRSKQFLSVHLNDYYAGLMPKEYASFQVDANEYPVPEYLYFSLEHTDVWLDFFLYPFRQDLIGRLRSGSPLLLTEKGCSDSDKNEVLRFSSKFQSVIRVWQEKGYGLHKAAVNFVVFWRKQDSDSGEVRIVLPKVVLKKCPGVAGK
ncbi:RecQ family ATP-dependent DNA helicase [uncultured Bacteroides sp.]|jgi:ATP-dependent DNA helicase, recQ family|uniref:RecQ family ATP-dependent DNA helicase n=1 Tax=uncultured Bacteroides sp. TaxID=162156 RepID=UPI00280AAFC4|nr:RecQ family ATP-dependent DNA helicase [uncultured Bacteroides sp.]